MRLRWLGLLLLGTLPALAAAQGADFDPTPVLAPYVNELTYAAGVVDAANIDFSSMATRLARAGVPKDEVAEMKEVVPAARDLLLKAGGRHVFFTFNLEDPLADGPLLVIPVAENGNPQAIAAVLAPLPGLSVKVQGRKVLAGRPATLERALKRKAAERPDLARALAAVAALPTRLALGVPPPLRRSLEELLPNLPAPLGGGPVTPVTRGLEWAGIGLDLSADRSELRAVLQARDADATQKLHQLGERALAVLVQQAQQRRDGELVAALRRLRPERKDNQVRLALDARGLDESLLPLIARVRQQASNEHSVNNLKQIVRAMHVYHDTHKTFPPQASFGKDGKPLLSWRVHLLPSLGLKTLYDQFKLDEPWDGPHNKALIAKMPSVYRSPFLAEAPAGRTTYLVPTGPEMIFDGPRTMKIAQIRDGTSNTILVVEAAEAKAVPWTQPADYPVDRKTPRAGLVVAGVGILAAFADGLVRTLPADTPDETMWRLLCPNDGQPVELP